MDLVLVQQENIAGAPVEAEVGVEARVVFGDPTLLLGPPGHPRAWREVGIPVAYAPLKPRQPGATERRALSKLALGVSCWPQGVPRPEPPGFQQMCREGVWSREDVISCALGARVWWGAWQLHPGVAMRMGRWVRAGLQWWPAAGGRSGCGNAREQQQLPMGWKWFWGVGPRPRPPLGYSWVRSLVGACCPMGSGKSP